MSLITQNIPIFTTYHLDTIFTLRNSNISTFLWDPHLITKLVASVSLPALIPHFLHFSFPLHPFNRVPLPKPKPEPIKMRWNSLASPPSPPSGLRLFLILCSVAKVPFFPPFCPFSSFALPRQCVPSPYFVFSLSCFTFFVCECLISFLSSSQFYSFLNWMLTWVCLIFFIFCIVFLNGCLIFFFFFFFFNVVLGSY